MTNMKPGRKMKKCKHMKAYMTVYGKYYCPDCDDMIKSLIKPKSKKKTKRRLNN